MRVASLELNVPREVRLESGQAMVFTAVPVGYDGNALHGLIAEWRSSNNHVLFIRKDGRAVAGNPGVAGVSVAAGQKVEHVKVTVTGEATAGPAKSVGGGSVRDYQGAEKVRITRAKWEAGGDLLPERSLRPARKVRPSPAAFVQSQPLDPLPDEETPSLYSPGNLVGSPAGKVRPGASTPPAAVEGDETAGRSNYSIGVPVASLPGRGLDVSLTLTYNSRVWHESSLFNGNKKMTFDVDKGWPALGFRLGYGHLEKQGNYGYTLIESDGTRREMTQVTWVMTHGFDSYESTDGTFIRFYGDLNYGALYYPDGTRVNYSSGGSATHTFPYQITDRNGNYITVSYRNGQGPHISSVQDTLGRHTRFHYDASNNLVAVTVPGYAGGADRQALRFYYADIPINQAGSFTGATVNAPSAARVISHVFSPGTGAGYRFDYSQSYGVIREIRQLRGMSVSYTGLDQMGVVLGEGQVAATTKYDYPAGPMGLSGAPQYSQRCDDWAGRTQGVNGDLGQWPCHTFADNRETGESTVTAPDGTVTFSRAVVSADEATNGLVTETEVRHGTTVFSRVRFEWGTDSAGNNQRVEKVFTTNEAGQTKATVYSYHPTYNNVSVVSERDFTTDPNALGPELRRTETTYETRAEWTNRRLLHLVTSVRVYAGGAAAPTARTDYAYDTAGSNLSRRDDIIMHEDASDPFAPPVTACGWECFEMPDGRCRRVWVCETTNPYDPATDKRGNLTQATRYADAAGATGTIVDAFSYDIAGNGVTQTADCCQQKQYTYPKSFEYAYATEERRGSAGQLTLKASYDFNTGLVRETVDENNQSTTIGYDPATLRHFRTNRPDGGYTQSYFSDSLAADPDAVRMHSYVSVTTATRTGGATTSYQFFDGRGAVARTFHGYTPANGYVTADVEYDLMGRPLRTSNPYFSGGSVAPATPAGGPWTTNAYDRLGRVAVVTLPDGNTLGTSYEGSAITFSDPTGKQRRQILDALGRLKEVHEPGGSGVIGPASDPAQATSYQYDALDNLVKITQADRQTTPWVTQVRCFKYDSLGRMTHERHVEQDAPHYAPDLLTGNDYWSRRTEYNGRGLVVDSYDARNVRTHVDYDGLNRVTQVSYSNEATTTTPAVTYTYDQARPGFNNHGRLTEVKTTLGGATQTVQAYDYDPMGRVVSHRQTVGGSTYTTGYGYNLAGHLTSQTYPSGRTVSYDYDDAARLSGVRDAARNYGYGMSYAPHGALSAESLGNGASHSFTYNFRLQMQQIKLSVGGAERQRFEYLYGVVNADSGAVDTTRNNGQMARVEGFTDGVPQWQQRLSYDPLGRLASAREVRGDNGQQAWRVDYTYDVFGNRYQGTGQSFGVPVAPADINRQTNRFASGIIYDGVGQVTADHKFRGTQYRYDANGRVDWSAYTNGAGGAASVYDGEGQRVATTSGGLTRHFVSNVFGQVIADYQPAGGWERDYVYRGGSLLATVEASGGVRYVTPDRQGSTRVITNESGAPVARHDYLPFGEELGAGHGMRSPTQGFGSTGAPRRRYAGTERDEQTGLEHTPWRKLETLSGRWTSPDPYNGSMMVSNPQSFNRYAFVGNDPANLIDPSGLLSMPDWAWEQLFEQGWRKYLAVIMGRESFQADLHKACDKRMSDIFGGVVRSMVVSDVRGNGRGADGHSAASRNDLPRFYISPTTGKRFRNSDRGGIIHSYTDESGSARKDVGLFAPTGWQGDPVNYYSGGNSGLRFTYPGGLTISFVHVGTTNPSRVPSIPSQSAADGNGRVRTGYVGGYGGEGAGYHHTHIIFYSDFAKDERVDPRSIFCGDMGF